MENTNLTGLIGIKYLQKFAVTFEMTYTVSGEALNSTQSSPLTMSLVVTQKVTMTVCIHLTNLT